MGRSQSEHVHEPAVYQYGRAEERHPQPRCLDSQRALLPIDRRKICRHHPCTVLMQPQVGRCHVPYLRRLCTVHPRALPASYPFSHPQYVAHVRSCALRQLHKVLLSYSKLDYSEAVISLLLRTRSPTTFNLWQISKTVHFGIARLRNLPCAAFLSFYT